MKNFVGYRGSYIVRNSYKGFLTKNKVLIVILSLSIILGIICGVFTALKSIAEISKFNINDATLVKFLKGNSSFLAFFSSRFFYYLFVLLIIFMLTFVPFLLPLPIIFLVYKSFILGSNLVVLISLFGIKGVFNVVFVFFPCQFLMLLCLGLIIICFVLKTLERKRYGKTCSSISNSKRWFLFIIPIFIINILEATLINFTYKTFIFVI